MQLAAGPSTLLQQHDDAPLLRAFVRHLVSLPPVASISLRSFVPSRIARMGGNDVPHPSRKLPIHCVCLPSPIVFPLENKQTTDDLVISFSLYHILHNRGASSPCLSRFVIHRIRRVRRVGPSDPGTRCPCRRRRHLPARSTPCSAARRRATARSASTRPGKRPGC